LKEQSLKNQSKKMKLNVQYAEAEPQEDDDLQRSDSPVNNWAKPGNTNKPPEQSLDTL